jgi:hypothetical protein
VHERLAGRFLLLRIAAVGDMGEAFAIAADADEVEQRAVGGAADDPVRVDPAVVRYRRIGNDLPERNRSASFVVPLN